VSESTNQPDARPPANGPADRPADVKPRELLPLVYDELRALARHRLATERAGHTLQPTALVHEAYLRLAGAGGGFVNRAQFFGAAAEAMRRILIDHARAKASAKRGGAGEGAIKRVPMNVLDLAASPESEDIVAVDEAVKELERETPLAASVVRLRFYGGLSIDEVAETLQLSPRTVNRQWTYARAWLFRRLNEEAP